MAILNYANQLNASRQGALGGMLQTAGQLQGLRANEQTMQRQRDQDSAQQQQAQNQVTLTREAQEVFARNDVNEIAAFSVANPDLGNQILASRGIVNAAGKERVSNRFANILTSANPQEALTREIAQGEANGLDMTQSKEILAQNLSPEGIKRSAGMALASIDGQRFKDIQSSFSGDEGFTLSQGQQRFDAEGNKIASVAPKAEKTIDQISIPPVLLDGLSEDLATKAAAAYEAAGGGKDGMAAYQRQVDKGTEQEKRLASPAILKANFPQASAAEMAQLQGTMDAARTTETGLKAADKVRTEQRRLVKAQGFQNRAIELLTSIIDSPDIGDVTGSIEGAYDFRPFSDDESSLIADIEEAGNILTADNLSLMSGVLSETDIKILKNLAGGGLIRTRGTERFKTDVTKLRDKLSSAMVVTTDERADKGNQNQDQQALEWANANPNDPRAAQILNKLGG